VDGPRRPTQRPRSRAQLLHVVPAYPGYAPRALTVGLAFAVLSAHVAPAAAASPGPTVTDPAGLGASEPGDEQAEAPLEAVPEASGPPAVTPGAALRSRRPAAASGNTGISVPADAIASSLRVAAVKVRLKVHRGGTRLPGGERVSRRGAVVDGDADYTLTRAARPGERIVLLNYAAALPREPSELDEVAVATYLDGPFKPATFELFDQDGAVRITRVGARGDLEVELRPGETHLRLVYRVGVPHRYWPLGCSRRRCSLDGAIAPLPSVPAAGGPALPAGRVLDPVRWDVAELRFADVPTWSPGQVPSETEARALRGDELVVARSSVGGDPRLAYPSVFWGPRWRRSGQYYRGARIEVLHMRTRPGGQVPAETRVQLRRDLPGQTLKVARESLDVARAAGMEVPVGSVLTYVQGPVRTNVAEFHPSVVVVSDQALQLWPSRRFSEFHTTAMARATLDLLTYGRQIGHHDPSTDLWVHGAMTMALLEVWRVQREHGDEFVSDIFHNFTFVPVVDNFLYSGQATFAQAYFRGSEDIMPLRVHPLYFSHLLPTGRRIHEKLGDLMSASQRAQLYIGLVADPDADPRRLAEAAYGRRLGWFFDEWLAPLPEVDYSVSGVKSVAADGRYRHQITVARDADVPVVEPVQVLARERGGRSHYLVWNGDAEGALRPKRLAEVPLTASHTFTLTTDRPLNAVTLDPRARLTETPRPHKNVDPLFNNRRPVQSRFVYTGIGFEISASEFGAAKTASARLQALSGRVLFEGSQRRDLRYTGHLQFQRDREASAAVGGGASIWLGDKVNRRRRRARIRLFADLQWLNANGLDQSAGVRVTQTAALIDDTRKFNLWPDRGRRLLLALHGGQTIRIGGAQDHRFSLTAAASWVQIWPLAHQHTIATRVELAIMAPLASQPEYRSLIRAGGLEGLGGYGGNEIFGRALALAQLEYRHVFFNNLDGNLLQLAWLRGLGGSLFTGVASTSPCGGYDGWFGRGSYHAQVGYGVTGFMQLLGVTPQFIRFDVAVPLVRRESVCLGHVHPNYLGEIQGLAPGQYTLPPIGLNLSFLQPF
jgi:hypothetical protein